MSIVSKEVDDIMAGFGCTGFNEDVEAKAREHEAREARTRSNARRRLLAEQGAPEFLLDKLATMGETQATRALANLSPGIVVLAGGVDTGKTVAALGWLLHAQGPVLYIQAARLPELKPWAKRPWLAAKAIVVDDLGTEHHSATQAVDDLVLHVHGRLGKTLVLTTNLLKADAPGHPGFGTRYGQRVTRRIRERQASAFGPWVAVEHRRLDP